MSLRPVLTGPDKAYLRSRVVFRCITPDSSPPVTYELIKDGGLLIDRRVDHQEDQPASFPLTVATTSDGSYYCKAKTGEATGISNSIRLIVVSEYQTHRESAHLVRALKSQLFSLRQSFISSPTVYHLLTSRSSVIYQCDLWALPPRHIRGLTHRPELRGHKGFPPFLHMVFQQEGSNVFNLFFTARHWEQASDGEGDSKACWVLLLHGLVQCAGHQEVFQQHRGQGGGQRYVSINNTNLTQ